MRYRVSPTNPPRLPNLPTSIIGDGSLADCHLPSPIGEGRCASDRHQPPVNTLFVSPLRRFGKRVGGCEGGRLGRDKAPRQSPAGDSTQANHRPPSGRSRPMGEGGRQRPPRSAANRAVGAVAVAWPMRPVRGKLSRSMGREEVGRRGRSARSEELRDSASSPSYRSPEYALLV